MPGLLDPRVRRPGRLASGDLLPEPLHQQTAGGPVPRRRAGNCPARACGLVLHRSTSLGRHGVYSRHASANAPPRSVLAPTRLTGASWTATPDDRRSSTHRNRIREDPNGIRGAVVQARRASRADGADRRAAGRGRLRPPDTAPPNCRTAAALAFWAARPGPVRIQTGSGSSGLIVAKSVVAAGQWLMADRIRTATISAQPARAACPQDRRAGDARAP